MPEPSSAKSTLKAIESQFDALNLLNKQQQQPPHYWMIILLERREVEIILPFCWRSKRQTQKEIKRFKVEEKKDLRLLYPCIEHNMYIYIYPTIYTNRHCMEQQTRYFVKSHQKNIVHYETFVCHLKRFAHCVHLKLQKKSIFITKEVFISFGSRCWSIHLYPLQYGELIKAWDATNAILDAVIIVRCSIEWKRKEKTVP